MSTEPTPRRHLLLIGPPDTAHTLWLREIVRNHLAEPDPRAEVWAITTHPAMYEPAGLLVTSNPDIAAGHAPTRWVSEHLAAVLREVGNEITVRADTTTGDEHPDARSWMLLALDDPNPARLTDDLADTLQTILSDGPKLGVTVAVSTSRLDEWPDQLVAALTEHATTVTLARVPLLLADPIPLTSADPAAPRFDLATAVAVSPVPPGHTLVLGPARAATAALRDLIRRYPTSTVRWLFAAADTDWPPENPDINWHGLDLDDLLTMLSGARYAVTDTEDLDLVMVIDQVVTQLPPRSTALEDLLAVLDAGDHRGLRVVLSAPDGEHLPDDVRRWFDEHPGRGTVLSVVVDWGRDELDGRYTH